LRIVASKSGRTTTRSPWRNGWPHSTATSRGRRAQRRSPRRNGDDRPPQRSSAIGKLPDVYVQAVGKRRRRAGRARERRCGWSRTATSGTGGTAGWVLSQNAPFTPIHDAWSRRAATSVECSAADTRERQSRIGATVLGNPAPRMPRRAGFAKHSRPPAAEPTRSPTTPMARAMLEFAELEGIDVEPAAGVALAALAAAVARRQRRPRRDHPAQRHRRRARAPAGGDRSPAPAAGGRARRDRGRGGPRRAGMMRA